LIVEPVGSHPAFQRLGLGKAVLLEALRRLHGKRMRQATVCTPEHHTAAVRLYASVGFTVLKRLGLYKKQ
jgi:mycothiol synthase